MTKSAVLAVILEGKNKVSGAVKGAEKDLSSLGQVGKAAGAAAAVGVAALGAAVAAFSVKAVQAGSAAQEMLSMFNTVFGASAARATEQLEAFGSEVGRSIYELQAMAASVQDTFVPLGFARDQAAELSVGLTKLATDVASFKNAADTDVMAAFTSALVGNHEAVRSFGIVITEAALNAELLRMGIDTATRAATEQEKVQARLNLLYAGTTDAQGDAAKTAGSWANLTKNLVGVLGELVTKVGLELIPVLTPMLEKFTAFVRDVTPAIIQAATDIITWLSNLGTEFELAAVRVEVSGDRIRAKAQQLGADTTTIGNQQVTFWAGVGMTIDQWVTNMLARISHFAESLSRGFATIGQAWEFVKVGNIQAAMDLIAYSFDLDTEAIQRTNEKIISFSEIIEYASQQGVSYGEALLALRMKADEASGALLTISDKARGNAEALETAGESVLSLQDVLASFSEGVVEIADVWKSAWDAIQEATSDGMDDNQRRIMEGFGAVREQYVEHAVTIAGLQNDMNNALLELDNEYQGLSKQLQDAGETAKLADLNAAYKAKQAGIVASYGAQIQTEQAGQTALLQGAKRYYVTTLSIMMQQLRAQVATVAANMRALVQMTVSGYMSMATAVAAYNAIKAGMTNIADIQAAMAEVQSAMAGIAAAGEAAVAAAAADFSNWNAATQDLGASLGDVDTTLGNISRPGGSGSNIRPQVVDPLEAAAKAAAQMANAVEKAIATFNALAKWGGPGAGWEAKFSLLITSIIAMVKRFAEAVVTIKNAGLLEEGPRNELLAFADMVGRVAKAFDGALASADKLAAFRPEAIGAKTVAAVEAMRLLVTSLAKLMAEMQTAMRPSASTAFDFDALAEFAAQVEAIMKPWKAAVDAIAAVASYGATRIGPAANMLLQQVYGLAYKLSQVNERLTGEAWDAAAEGAGRVEQIVRPWRAMVDAIKSLAEYTFVRVGPAANTLLDQIYGLAYKLSQFNDNLAPQMWNAAAQAADRITEVTGFVKGAIDAITALAAYVAAQGLTEAVGAFLDDIVTVAREIALRLGDAAALVISDETVALSEGIGRLVAFIRGSIDALNALAEYALAVDFAEPISRLMADLVVVAQGIVFGLRGMGRDVLAGLEEAAPATEQLGRLVAFVRGAVDALNALAGYGQEARGSLAQQTALFMADLTLAAREIVFGLRTMGRDVLASVEEMAPTAELIGRLVSFVRGAVDAIAALMAYSAGARGLPAKVQAFVVDILVVAGALQTGLGSLTEELTAAYDGAIAFGERIGRLVGVVQPGIDAIRALTDYQGALGLPAAVRAFVTDVLALAHELRVGLGSLSAPLTTAYDGAIEFGERIGRIVAVVRPGIDAIAAVTGYQAAENLPAAVRAFGRDVVAMASELRLAFGSLTEPLATAFDGAIEFADRIARIVAVVRPGIDAIAAVVGYKAAQGLAGKVQAFAADVLLVAEELRVGLGTPSEEMLAAYDAAATWATKITGILALIQPAMAALQELSRYGGGAATALHAGMEKLTRNVASLINFLSSHYQILGGEAVAQAQTFAESIVAIVSAIRRGLEEAAGIEGMNATYDGAFVVGQNWITGIVDGITSRLSDLTDLMAYIRGLFPSSPAQYGPWRDLPVGNEVTQRWLAGMSQELRRTGDLERSLAGVRGMYAGLGSGAYVGAGARGLGAGDGGGDVTVNLSMGGPFYIRQDADVEKLATAVGEVLARQAGLTRRMGQQARRTT